MSTQQTLKNAVLFKQGGVPDETNVITLDGLVFLNPKVGSGDYSDIGNGQMGNTKSFTDENNVTAEFDIPVIGRGGGTAGTSPKIANLLKCCGLAETITAGTKVEYKPGGDLTRGQCKVYTDGYVRLVEGIMCDMEISGKVGDLARIVFSAKGYTTAKPTAEANPIVTLDTENPPIISSATAFTVGGGTINISEFKFSLGNSLQSLYAVDKKEYYLQDFDPSVTTKAIKTKGNETHWDDYVAGNVKVIQIVIGTVPGQIIQIDIPFAKPKEVSESDSNGVVVYDQTYRCQSSVGNDNFTLTFK